MQTIKDLQEILNNPERCKEVMKEELQEVKEKYKTLKSCPFKVFLIQINGQSCKVVRHYQARYGIYQKG